MASLKELKNRIKSVKSTQKITKAKQMVAAWAPVPSVAARAAVPIALSSAVRILMVSSR